MSKDNEERRIPRPPNAFMLFGQQHRREIARQFPNLTNKQISKILGNEWRNMRPDDKSFYHRLADEAHADHMKKYPGYYYSPVEARQRKAERKRKYMQKMSVRRNTNDNNENILAIQKIPDESQFSSKNVHMVSEEIGIIQNSYQSSDSQLHTSFMHLDCANLPSLESSSMVLTEPIDCMFQSSDGWCTDHSYAATIETSPATVLPSLDHFSRHANNEEVNFALLLADYLPPMDDPIASMIKKDETLSSLISKDDDDDNDYFTFTYPRSIRSEASSSSNDIV